MDQTERLKETCRQGKWSKIAVLEPEWLTGVEGWVPTGALRGLKNDAQGRRTYAAEDFMWDKHTTPHKAALVEVVNRLVRESSDCTTVDPGTLARSTNRTLGGKSVFFVTCQGGNVHNVWFTASGEWVN